MKTQRGPKLGRRIGGAVDGAMLRAMEAAGKWARIRLPAARIHHRSVAETQPGAPPGIEGMPDLHTPPPPGKVTVTCIDFSPDRVEQREVTDLDAFLGERRPDWAAVRWVNIDGLDTYTVNRFREAYGFHTLAAEDVLHVPQRPRLEPYPDHLFLIARMVRMEDHQVLAEQVSIFFYGHTLLSFQEDHRGDVWSPLRKRIQTAGSKVRQNDGGFLLYSMLDAIVDHLFPIVETFGDELELLEDELVDRPHPDTARRLHTIRRHMVLLRRVIWPTRLMLHDLQTSEEESLSPTAKTYLRDVHEHALQLIDVVETYRDMAAGMIELYLSAVSFRMNEVMKVLTIIATLFIPITFLAGVYGMNFKFMPEYDWRWSYPVFWLICAAVVVSLLIYFRRKGWIGTK